MTFESQFPHIFLAESPADDCLPALKNCVKKYTHIQSFNGILLDGLDYSHVANIIETSFLMPSVQLTVRSYVNFETFDEESLPVPLMIVGDITTCNRELYKYLSGADRKSDNKNDTDSSDTSLNKYVKKSSVSDSLFSKSSQSNPSPCNCEKRLHMFTQEVDRRLVHLFFRESNIYLVVVNLDNLVEDAAIEFENLLYWLHVTQIYQPGKGVIIVGMCNHPMNSQKESKWLNYFEGAIQEANYQHIYSSEDGKSVVMFDLSKPEVSLDLVCRSISRCMDVRMTRAWYVDRPFFEKVFQPFTGLTEVLSTLSRSQETLMSPESVQSIYQLAHIHYFDTLTAHSSALISSKGEWGGAGNLVS